MIQSFLEHDGEASLGWVLSIFDQLLVLRGSHGLGLLLHCVFILIDLVEVIINILYFKFKIKKEINGQEEEGKVQNEIGSPAAAGSKFGFHDQASRY